MGQSTPRLFSRISKNVVFINIMSIVLHTVIRAYTLPKDRYIEGNVHHVCLHIAYKCLLTVHTHITNIALKH